MMFKWDIKNVPRAFIYIIPYKMGHICRVAQDMAWIAAE
jgi:hypothetical protein